MKATSWICVITVLLGIALARLSGGLNLGVLLLTAIAALCMLYVSRRKGWL